jgi:inorganic pyrophosphatase
MRYPGNYGFVPHTLSQDRDPIDVLIANTRPIVPGAVVNVRPIGVLKMEDDGGGDEKIIAVPVPKLTKRYAYVTNYTDLPEITLAQIQHFFAHYKDLEPGKWVKVIGWGDADEARRMIVDAIGRAKDVIRHEVGPARAHCERGRARELRRHHLWNAYSLQQYVRADAQLPRPHRRPLDEGRTGWQGRQRVRQHCHPAWRPTFHSRLLHQGMIIVGLPYAFAGLTNMDEVTGGSPYGATTLAKADGSHQPSANELDGARYQGKHVAQIAAKLAHNQ